MKIKKRSGETTKKLPESGVANTIIPKRSGDKVSPCIASLLIGHVSAK